MSQVAGKFYGKDKVLVKFMDSKNFFIKYQGWCVADKLLEKMQDEQEILLWIDKQRVLSTTAGMFRSKGKTVEYGHGWQTCLPQKYWNGCTLQHLQDVMGQ